MLERLSNKAFGQIMNDAASIGVEGVSTEPLPNAPRQEPARRSANHNLAGTLFLRFLAYFRNKSSSILLLARVSRIPAVFPKSALDSALAVCRNVKLES